MSSNFQPTVVKMQKFTYYQNAAVNYSEKPQVKQIYLVSIQNPWFI